MTIFDVLNMIGGLCLFLFGMNVMGDGLERRAGNSLKALLSKLTGSKLKGFLTGLLERIAYLIVPEDKEAEKVVELDERLLATPTIALQQCSQLVQKMAQETVDGFQLSLQSLTTYDAATAQQVRKIEGNIDHYEDILGTYLTKIARAQISDDDSSEVSKLLKVIGDFERISDHSVNVLESVEELLTNLERTSDHCSNIALSVIDAAQHNMNAHEAHRELKHNNPIFQGLYASYSEKFTVSH